jgi:putative tryptophan/tyrosine transport system substrate-binding protein
MRRRSIVIGGLAGIAFAPSWALAQQTSVKTPRIGVLSPADSDKAASLEAFREALRELGYVEGQNIALEFCLGNWALLPGLATELVQLPVDAILVDGGAGVVRAVMQMTDRIPIVSATGGDLVVTGVVANLARPGGTVTGFTLGHSELNPKRLEILRTTFPDKSSVALLVNSSNANASEYLSGTEEAARTMGVQRTARVEVATLEALLALKPAVFDGAEAVMVLPDAVFWNHRRAIVALLDAARLPAIYPERICRGWRVDGLRRQRARQFPPRCRLYRPHTEGRQPR